MDTIWIGRNEISGSKLFINYPAAKELSAKYSTI
jgi:hypothetical protein